MHLIKFKLITFLRMLNLSFIFIKILYDILCKAKSTVHKTIMELTYGESVTFLKNMNPTSV